MQYDQASIFDLVAEDVVEAIVPEVVHYCVAVVYHVPESFYPPDFVCLLEGCHLALQRYLRLPEHVSQVLILVALGNLQA